MKTYNVFIIVLSILTIFIVSMWFSTIPKEKGEHRTEKNQEIKEGFESYLNDYHIVCAKYNKSTDFLNNIGIKSTIIEKDGTVPNKANEATSYLYYIVKNYDHLPKHLIFIHDEDKSWHHDGRITENLQKWIKTYEKNGHKYYNFNNSEMGENNDLYDKNPAFKHFWDNTMKSTLGNYSGVTYENGKCCSQFIVSGKKILEKPREFYKKMYDWLITKTNGTGNGNKSDVYSGYWTGRYAEFSWRYIFM